MMKQQFKRIAKVGVRVVFAVYMLMPAGARHRIRSQVKRVLSKHYDKLQRQVMGPPVPVADFGNYPVWSKSNVALSQTDRDLILKDIEKMTEKPLIAVVMPVYNTDEDLLIEAIESVRSQLYTNFEFCIVDDNSSAPHVAPLLNRYAQEDKRIKVVLRTENGHISLATNDGLTLVTAPYVGFVDHDDILMEHALYYMVRSIKDRPEGEIFYSDEDKIEDDGRPGSHHFKPEWNPLLYLACNYTCHFSIFKTELVHKVGGLRAGFEGAQDWDLTLRCSELVRGEQIVHVPAILYHWRSIPGSTAQVEGAKPYVALAQTRTVEEALKRRGVEAEVVRINRWGIVHFYEKPPRKLPKVSVIVPTKDRVKVFQACLESLYRVTEYPDFEVIIVDNGSVEQESLRYFEDVKKLHDARIIRDEREFNFARLNNVAVQESTGEILCLLNNDIEIFEPNWMSRLVVYAMKNDVGAVGPRLLFPNGTVQHGGVIVGHGGVAGHAHLGIHEDYAGYAARAVVDQYMSAVTGACLFVRKEVYDEVGGLDEHFAVAYNDVDFCLRLQKIGLRNVYAGSVTCVHHESKTRGYEDTRRKKRRLADETNLMIERWGKFAEDPSYNPNLTLSLNPFGVLEPSRAQRPWK